MQVHALLCRAPPPQANSTAARRAQRGADWRWRRQRRRRRRRRAPRCSARRSCAFRPPTRSSTSRRLSSAAVLASRSAGRCKTCCRRTRETSTCSSPSSRLRSAPSSSRARGPCSAAFPSTIVSRKGLRRSAAASWPARGRGSTRSRRRRGRGARAARPVRAAPPRRRGPDCSTVGFLLCTVTFHANLAHSLTRSR